MEDPGDVPYCSGPLSSSALVPLPVPRQRLHMSQCEHMGPPHVLTGGGSPLSIPDPCGIGQPPPEQQAWSLGTGHPPQQGARASLCQPPSREPRGPPGLGELKARRPSTISPGHCPSRAQHPPRQAGGKACRGSEGVPGDLQVCHSSHRDLRPQGNCGPPVLFAGRTQHARVPPPSRESAPRWVPQSHRCLCHQEGV